MVPVIISKETTPQSNFKCHTLFELNILLKFKDAFVNGMQIKICAIVNVFLKTKMSIAAISE